MGLQRTGPVPRLFLGTPELYNKKLSLIGLSVILVYLRTFVNPWNLSEEMLLSAERKCYSEHEHHNVVIKHFANWSPPTSSHPSLNCRKGTPMVCCLQFRFLSFSFDTMLYFHLLLYYSAYIAEYLLGEFSSTLNDVGFRFMCTIGAKYAYLATPGNFSVTCMKGAGRTVVNHCNKV